MKSTEDLVRGWIKKADSDLENVTLCIQSNKALDTACFHAQQAAEKYIKAYMLSVGLNFPFSHNLEKLIDMCAQRDASFGKLAAAGLRLTPFAVSMRYDADFWPTLDEVKGALNDAESIRFHVFACLPFSPI